MSDNEDNILKVKADDKEASYEEKKENVKKLAGAISHSLRENDTIYIRAVGDGCIEKAVKALCIAKRNLIADNLSLSYIPFLIDVEMGDNLSVGGVSFRVSSFDRIEEEDEIDWDSFEGKVLRVAADLREADHIEKINSRKKLASAIMHTINQDGEVAMKCLKRAAVVKGVRSIIQAISVAAMHGKELEVWSDYLVIQNDDKYLSGVVFYIFESVN
jgi:stage V sporulation protein SpoVS